MEFMHAPPADRVRQRRIVFETQSARVNSTALHGSTSPIKISLSRPLSNPGTLGEQGGPDPSEGQTVSASLFYLKSSLPIAA